MKLVHWPLVGGVLHLVQRGGDWAWSQPAQPPPLAVPNTFDTCSIKDQSNVTAHPSTASVPTTVLQCNGPLLCGFNAGIREITWRCSKSPALYSQHYIRLMNPRTPFPNESCNDIVISISNGMCISVGRI